MDDRYLLHISECDRWPAALGNLRSLCDQGLGRQVTVVINGTAIFAVQGPNDWTGAMERAAHQGVAFEICSRSLASHEVPPETLPAWITPVPSAMPAIAGHVADGFVYIKP